MGAGGGHPSVRLFSVSEEEEEAEINKLLNGIPCRGKLNEYVRMYISELAIAVPHLTKSGQNFLHLPINFQDQFSIAVASSVCVCVYVCTVNCHCNGYMYM